MSGHPILPADPITLPLLPSTFPNLTAMNFVAWPCPAMWLMTSSAAP